MDSIKIVGTGYAKADQLVTNDDLSKIVETNDEWIYSRTGIHNRYVNKTSNTSDLAYLASLQAIKDAKIDSKKIGLIIVATLTPDDFTPSVACLLQAKLGLNDQNIMAFDLNAACSGFVYSLLTASKLLEKDQYALVVGAETLSKLVDWTDRTTCVLFGDGAGACILAYDEKSKMVGVANSQGDLDGYLIAKGVNLDSRQKGYGNITMNGTEVFKFAIQAMPQAIEDVLEKANQKIEDIDLIIAHQANIRILQRVSKQMNVPMDKFYVNLEQFGNTSAASIAIALATAKEEEYLKEGMKVILVGFGGGFTYGAIYIEY